MGGESKCEDRKDKAYNNEIENFLLDNHQIVANTQTNTTNNIYQ